MKLPRSVTDLNLESLVLAKIEFLAAGNKVAVISDSINAIRKMIAFTNIFLISLAKILTNVSKAALEAE